MVTLHTFPAELDRGASLYLVGSELIASLSVSFRTGACLEGPVGTSLAITALDQRAISLLGGLSSMAGSASIELGLAASIYRTVDGW